MCEPLVLIPGLQSDASSWLPMLELLGRHFPLTVPRGHQFAPSIGDMAAKVVRQSPQRFHLVGWSMGGYIAFEILRQYPERIASLSLIATSAEAESQQASERRKTALRRARNEGLRGYQRANLFECLHAPDRMRASELEALLVSSEKLGIDALEIQIEAISARPNSMADLAASHCPVMIIAGRNDRIIPAEHSRTMHHKTEGSVYHEISDCGHCPPLEKTELVAGLMVDWIASLDNLSRTPSDN